MASEETCVSTAQTGAEAQQALAEGIDAHGDKCMTENNAISVPVEATASTSETAAESAPASTASEQGSAQPIASGEEFEFKIQYGKDAKDVKVCL